MLNPYPNRYSTFRTPTFSSKIPESFPIGIRSCCMRGSVAEGALFGILSFGFYRISMTP